MIATPSVFLGTGIYLILLLTATGLLSRRLRRSAQSQHPMLLVLALGVYAYATGLVVSLDLAYHYGFGFLAYSLGLTGAFLLAPVLMFPLFKLATNHQLFSLPDLLAFRYRSQGSGSLATLVSIAGLLLLLAVQVRVFISSIELVSGQVLGAWGRAGLIAVALLLATLTQSARQTDHPPTTPILVLLGLHGAVKLFILLGVGIFLIFGQFGGLDGLDQWIEINGQRISAMDRHLGDDPWRALLLLFFSAGLVFPPIFHLLFAENRRPDNLFKASWGLPAYLLLFSLPVPVILWSGIKLAAPATPEHFLLGLGLSLNSPLWMLLISVASLASGLVLFALASISVSGMCINHLILPLVQPRPRIDIYRWLDNYRRIAIFLAIALPWLLDLLVPPQTGPSELVIVAFSLLVQLLPGTLSVVNWPQGNHRGFLAGLALGCLTWFITLYLPWIHGVDLLSMAGLKDAPLAPGDSWHFYLLVSLAVNSVGFAGLSTVTTVTSEQAATARACSVDTLLEKRSRDAETLGVGELIERLTGALGRKAALREVDLAMRHLGLSSVEQRPVALKRLRSQIEANLSGLLGPTMAQSLISRYLDRQTEGREHPSDVYFVESRLEDYHTRLSGLAAELDQLRRYHRQILQQLPIATCSLGENREIQMWNQAMETLTGLREDEIVGVHLTVLPHPWAEILSEFSAASASHQPKKRVQLDGSMRWLNLHKAILDPSTASGRGQVILIEDCTETQLLEEELIHSERLASVGRLAAGVAHEIGNPITGIACLSQNLKLMTADPEVLDTARQILDQTNRISRILQTLMHFSRRGNHTQAVHLTTVPVRHCVEEAIHLLQLSPDAVPVGFINDVGDDCRVLGDDQRLVQVFVNLLSNARDASPANATIRVSAQTRDQWVDIRVVDEGCGISAVQRDRLFEPFYTTKGPDKGTGLGLALVYGIIDDHFGHIRLESPVGDTGRGTQVIIELPRPRSDSR